MLKVLLGRLAPTLGQVRHGTRLEPAYFDQMRAQLDEDRSLQENITDRVGGSPALHDTFVTVKPL